MTDLSTNESQLDRGNTATAGNKKHPRLSAYFGEFGGQFVPELLMPALDQLEDAFIDAMQDESFKAELDELLKNYLGRPTPLTECRNLPLQEDGSRIKGVRIFLKREDLVHGGAHKTNQVLAQALLAKRMGKSRIIAETGAGQHGTATALACALLGLECTIYMGKLDVQRQAPNVYRMKLMGANVVAVDSGSGTLKDAVNEALRDWTATFQDSHYLLGTAAGPHPFPTLVREFHRVISTETKDQIRERTGRLPNEVIACVGGGSNAIGIFADFIDEDAVALTGVEPAGEGLHTTKHGAAIHAEQTGVLHGARTYVMRTDQGQVCESHSISAGLDYPAVGPQHAHLHATGRAQYVGVTDREALGAFIALSRFEGIIPALESAHALAYALKRAKEAPSGTNLVVSLSGRGDKDVAHVQAELERLGDPYGEAVLAELLGQVLQAREPNGTGPSTAEGTGPSTAQEAPAPGSKNPIVETPVTTPIETTSEPPVNSVRRNLR